MLLLSIPPGIRVIWDLVPAAVGPGQPTPGFQRLHQPSEIFSLVASCPLALP